jgi:hypothetical protein
MEIQREYGEADAHLHLPPPSPSSVLAEALEEQVAKIDYTVKLAKKLSKFRRSAARSSP